MNILRLFSDLKKKKPGYVIWLIAPRGSKLAVGVHEKCHYFEFHIIIRDHNECAERWYAINELSRRKRESHQRAVIGGHSPRNVAPGPHHHIIVPRASVRVYGSATAGSAGWHLPHQICHNTTSRLHFPPLTTHHQLWKKITRIVYTVRSLQNGRSIYSSSRTYWHLGRCQLTRKPLVTVNSHLCNLFLSLPTSNLQVFNPILKLKFSSHHQSNFIVINSF